MDHVAEPKRSVLVPGFSQVKAAAIAAGALGCSLSGSGPSVFALTRSLHEARAVGDAMAEAYETAGGGIAADLWVSAVGTTGARVLTDGGGR